MGSAPAHQQVTLPPQFAFDLRSKNKAPRSVSTTPHQLLKILDIKCPSPYGEEGAGVTGTGAENGQGSEGSGGRRDPRLRQSQTAARAALWRTKDSDDKIGASVSQAGTDGPGRLHVSIS